MADVHACATGRSGPEADGFRLKRLRFELVLQMADAKARPPEEIVRHAARMAGVDLLFVLPASNAREVSAMVRLSERGRESLLQVRGTGAGFAVAEGSEIDPLLLGFAHASVDVLERLRVDPRILEPLASASH